MNDFARLEEKLTKLRRRERAPGEGRKLRGADGDEKLAALVTEIDETILPRRLTLTIDDQAEIHLAVANRRLQAMVGPAPSVDGAEDVVDKALPDADDPAVPALREVLSKVLSKAEKVSVSASRLQAVFESDVGIPANVLSRAWNISEDPKTSRSPAEMLDGYVNGLGDKAVAWLRINGEEVADQGGEADRLAALGEQAAVFLDGYFSKFDGLFPEGSESCATVIAGAGDSGAAVLFIEYVDVSAFIAAKPAEVVALATRWQTLVAE